MLKLNPLVEIPAQALFCISDQMCAEIWAETVYLKGTERLGGYSPCVPNLDQLYAEHLVYRNLHMLLCLTLHRLVTDSSLFSSVLY